MIQWLSGVLTSVHVCTLSSVGPCALEYTKLKTSDHFWTDPSANELVQRHRIHGAHRGQDVSAGRRPALGVSEGFPQTSGAPLGFLFRAWSQKKYRDKSSFEPVC